MTALADETRHFHRAFGAASGRRCHVNRILGKAGVAGRDDLPRQLQTPSLPPELIARAAWLCFRFLLSLRRVEEMLPQRSIVVSYETFPRLGSKFGPDYARRLRRKPPRPDDIWHLDEVVIYIAGKTHWLGRAADQDGPVLDEIVQSRRYAKAAKRVLTRSLEKHSVAPSGWSPTNCSPMMQPSIKSCLRSSIGPTKASTAGPKTAMSRCEGANV